MKKTNLLLAVSAVAVLFFAACSNNNPQLLNGTFSQTTISETDLADSDAPDSTVAVSCKVKKTIELNFVEDGNYTLSVKQNVSDIEFFDAATFTIGDITDYFNREITIAGKYSATKSKLTLTNETVTLADGQTMDFIEYQTYDPSAGTEIQTVKYSVNEKELSLFQGNSSITYTRK